MKKNTKMGRPSKMPVDEAKLLEQYGYFTAGQLAKVYDVSEGTVRSWVCRIRKKEREGLCNKI